MDWFGPGMSFAQELVSETDEDYMNLRISPVFGYINRSPRETSPQSLFPF